MKPKPVVLRDLARRDVDDAVDHYAREAGEKIALAFVDAVESVLADISRQPATGSPRYAHELGLPDLRNRPVKRFPYLVFYIEMDDRIDVWRVLHGRRDIPAWMQEA